MVGGIQPNQIENDLLQEGKILWGVVFTYGAGILAEADVEDPVKSILDGPMASHGDGKLFGGQLARADVIAPLEVRFIVADLAQGVNQTDRFALEPLAKLAIQPNFSELAVGNGGWLAATSGMIGVWKP